MFASARQWLRKNRRPIAIGTAVVGGAYLTGQYVLNKITEARERSHLDRIAKENIRRRFEQNQADCTITVIALLPTLTENVLEALPCEQLTTALQQRKAERLARASGEGASEVSSLKDGDLASTSSFQTGSFVHASQMSDSASQIAARKSKGQLWNELKITSITRALTLIYSLSLLTILTRIQLNLLGRLNYLSSVMSLAQPPQPGLSNSISLEDHDDVNANFGNDFETNRRYLAFSYNLLHKGHAQIMAKVRAAAEDVFGSVSPTEAISAERLRELILQVRKQVEGSSEQERYATRWLPYILPPREEEESLLIESGVITPPHSSSSASSQEHSTSFEPPRRPQSYVDTSAGPLRQLLDETADLIDSPTFTRIHTLILNTMFSLLVDQKIIATSYPQTQTQSPPGSEASAPQPRIQEIDSAVTVVPGEPRVKLGNVLAKFTTQAHVIGNGNALPNEYISAAETEVRELEAFAAVIYASHLEHTAEDARTKSKSSDGGLRSAEGTGVGDVDAQQVDEMIESKLESAWAKVAGTTFQSR